MKVFCTALAVMFVLVGTATSDIVVVSNNVGEIHSRQELDLTSSVSFVSFGSTEPIATIAPGLGTGVLIGSSIGQPHVRDALDLTINSVPTTNFTSLSTQAVGAIGIRSDGDVVLGTDETQMFVRSSTDLRVVADGYGCPIPIDGHFFNQSVTGVAILSSDDVVVTNAGGEVFVRDGTCLLNNAPGTIEPYVNYGIPINAVALTTDDKIVIGLQSGLVDVRNWDDVTVSLSNVDFGIPITSLATLSNGDVAIGLSDGEVHIRSTTNLGAASSSSANFTDGDIAITALATTSNDNVVIGTANNLVFVRDSSNVTLTPAGYQGIDGLNFNAPITGVAAVSVPAPTTCAEAISSGYGLAADVNEDCYVDQGDVGVLVTNWPDVGCLSPDWCNGSDIDQSGEVNLTDAGLLAVDWLRCVDPQDAGCETPWQ